MKRRTFIAAIGSAAAWPAVARAQRGERMRRIGVLMSRDENDPLYKSRLSAFTQALADLGWSDGRNVRMDLRWGGGDADRIPAVVQELVGLQPNIILAESTVATVAVQRETRTIPIVFVNVGDPVAQRIVPRLDRPGGNATGFAAYEPSLGGKWLELLSEIAPGLKRAAIMFNPNTAVFPLFMPSFETAARSLKVAPITAPIQSEIEIETAIIALGREPEGGLVVLPDIFTVTHHAPIVLVAARNKIPPVYGATAYAEEGGLLHYGPSVKETYRSAATYVDRILRGATPGDLPVQFPTKFEMVVNLKTAKALGLTVPQSILLSADEVIQ